MPDSDGTGEAWLAELAALENAVIEVDRALADSQNPVPDLAAWQRPTDLGPIPENLRGHAVKVHRDQQEALRRLGEARAAAGQHLAALRSVPVPAQARTGTLDITG